MSLEPGRLGWSRPRSLEAGRGMLQVIAAILRPAPPEPEKYPLPPHSTPKSGGFPPALVPTTYSKFQQSSYFYYLL